MGIAGSGANPEALRVTANLFEVSAPWTIVLTVSMIQNDFDFSVPFGLTDGYPTPTNYLLVMTSPSTGLTLGLATTGGVTTFGDAATDQLMFRPLSSLRMRQDSIALRHLNGRVSLWRNGRWVVDVARPAFTPTNLVIGGDYSGIGFAPSIRVAVGRWGVWTRALRPEELLEQRRRAVPVSYDRLWAWWVLDEDPSTVLDRWQRRPIDAVVGVWDIARTLEGAGAAADLPPRRRLPVVSAAGVAPTVPDLASSFAQRAARIGGEPLVELFDLSVSAPEARTWRLSHAPVLASALWSGSPDYQGLVLASEPATQAVAVGGVGPGATAGLVIDDRLGTAGPGGGAGRRFSDWFATPVPGSAEPYDLDGARLTVSWAVPGLAQSELYPVAALALVPESKQHDPGALRLAFAEDPLLWGPLPRRKVGVDLFPNAAPEEFGQPIPLVFGRRRRVRCLAVDAQNGRYLACESPQATPIRRIRHVLAVFTDPDTNLGRVTQLAALDWSVPVESWSTGATYRSLTVARAQEVILPAGILVDRVVVGLRPKAGGVPVGRVTLSLKWMTTDQEPSGTLIGRDATAEVNAALITAPDGAWTAFTFDHAPPIWPENRAVAVVVAYAPEAGGGEVEILMDDDGGYLLGTSFEESQSQWLRSGKNLKVHPVTGDPAINDEQTGSAEQGDAMLHASRGLSNYAVENGEHVLITGQWYAPYPPRSLVLTDSDDENDTIAGPTENTLRSFLVYDITGITDAVSRVLLRLYLVRAYHVPTGVDLVLEEILDPRPIANGKYNIATRRSYGAIATSATAEGTWIVTDVTASFENARADDLDHLCFRLRVSNEALAGQGAGAADDDLDAIGYAIGAAENLENHRNELKIVLELGRDLCFYVFGRTFTVSPSIDDGGGNFVALIDFGVDLDNPIIAARIDGMEDDAEGSYTAIPHSLICNGADIARFMLSAPIARGLSATQINDPSLIASRSKLLQGDKDRATAVRPYLSDGLTTGIAMRQWGPLAGVISEELDARQWLARLGQCCKSLFYVDYLGRVTMWTDGPAATTAAAITPEQIGSLAQISSGDRSQGLPWTRVEVLYNRDLLSLPNTRPKFNQPEWNDFALIAAGRSLPYDRMRQRAAALLTARYGVRTNGGPQTAPRTPGVPWTLSEAITFHFLCGEPDQITALLVRNHLWDKGSQRPDPFDVIELALPRFALTLRPMDEITVEAYDFASECDRALLGAITPPALAPEGWDVPIYRCRRGRFSVRSLTPRLASGGDFPVHITAQLLGWETP